MIRQENTTWLTHEWQLNTALYHDMPYVYLTLYFPASRYSLSGRFDGHEIVWEDLPVLSLPESILDAALETCFKLNADWKIGTQSEAA